mgnify:CR=1 FL=1
MRHYEIVFLVHPDQSEQVPGMVERYTAERRCSSMGRSTYCRGNQTKPCKCRYRSNVNSVVLPWANETILG